MISIKANFVYELFSRPSKHFKIKEIQNIRKTSKFCGNTSNLLVSSRSGTKFLFLVQIQNFSCQILLDFFTFLYKLKSDHKLCINRQRRDGKRRMVPTKYATCYLFIICLFRIQFYLVYNFIKSFPKEQQHTEKEIMNNHRHILELESISCKWTKSSTKVLKGYSASLSVDWWFSLLIPTILKYLPLV